MSSNHDSGAIPLLPMLTDICLPFFLTPLINHFPGPSMKKYKHPIENLAN